MLLTLAASGGVGGGGTGLPLPGPHHPVPGGKPGVLPGHPHHGCSGHLLGWTQADWDSWAGGLEWYLTRDAADSPQDPDLYPNVYTGDALKNWMSWGTINGNGADGSPYFTLEPPHCDGGRRQGHPHPGLLHGVFFENETTGNSLQSIGSGAFRYTRNVWGSFIGDYDLSVRQGADTLASTQLEVTVYESYLRYDELYQELLEIQRWPRQGPLLRHPLLRQVRGGPGPVVRGSLGQR